jgi:hypothetical protein
MNRSLGMLLIGYGLLMTLGWLQACGTQVAAERDPDIPTPAVSPTPTDITCSSSWSLPQVRLKDHSLFAYQDFLYLVSIKIDLPAKDDRSEYTFAYARTNDFCTWEYLGTALTFGAEGDADESYIWAPHVVEENDTFFMFYTGVNRHISQSIMLATSSHPADPTSWVKQGVIFRPNHPGMVYAGAEHWSDARDPMVLKYNQRYYLYYTGRDVTGGIVGVAMADALVGPWYDLGAVVRLPATLMPESPFVVAYNNFFYLYYNAAGDTQHPLSGPQWQWAPSPLRSVATANKGAAWVGTRLFLHGNGVVGLLSRWQWRSDWC